MKFKDKLIQADKKIMTVVKYISYVTPVCMIVIALLASVDVVTAKLFGFSIPNQMEIIAYLLIPVVYLSVAYVQMDRGLTNVDLFTRKMGVVGRRISKVLTSVLGFIVYGFAAYRSYFLFQDYFKYKRLSSTSPNSFQTWPFTVIYGIGTLLLALILLWSIVRAFILPVMPPEESSPNEDTEI